MATTLSIHFPFTTSPKDPKESKKSSKEEGRGKKANIEIKNKKIKSK
jgi:hypothetical protein